MSPFAAKLARQIGAVVFLAAVFLAYSYPLVWHWDAQIIGLDKAFADTPQILSNLYLFQADLAAGSYGHTQELFYPVGASTWMHGFIPGMSLLYAFIGGNVFSFLNSFLLCCFVLSGLGAYRLAQGYTTSFVGALLVAFVFTFSSFHLAQWQDHYWYVINFTLPWYLLYFPKVFDFHPQHWFFRLASIKYLLICFALGIVSASLEYYTTFFLIYLSVFYAFWKRYLSQIKWTWAPWKKALSWGIGILLISFLIDTLRSLGMDDNHGFYWSGDLAGLVVPQNNKFFGTLFASWQGAWQEPGPDEKNIFLGFSFILGLSLAKRLFWKETVLDAKGKNLFYATTFLLVLCFPVLKVFGITLLKLPSALLHYVPFLNNIRVPTRWAILVYLFAMLFLVRMFELGLSTKRRNWAFSILILALVFEYWPNTYLRFPASPVDEHVELIKAEKGEVLMTLPFGVRDGFKMIGEQDNRLQYEQTLHHKKMLGGYFSRVADTVFHFYEQDALCRDLFSKMDKSDSSYILQDYSSFFMNFHPNLLYLRKDYVGSRAWLHFAEACWQQGIKLEKVSPQLYRIIYP